MRVSDAYEKVVDELHAEVSAAADIEIPDNLEDLGAVDFRALAEAGQVLDPYAYGGSAKEFIYSRSTRMANEMLADLPAGEDLRDAFAAVVEGGFVDRWLPSLLQIFAMGYSFAAPEYREVPRNKEGFLKLCREVDRELINIQVAQFSADEELRAQIDRRIEAAGAFTSHMFAVLNRPITRAAVREWVEKVYGVATLDCFVIGQRVRNLFEEEAAFEAMMNKEND